MALAKPSSRAAAPPPASRARRRGPISTIAVLATVLALTLTACSSSGGTQKSASNSPKSGTTSSQPGDGGSGSAVDKAQAFVKPYLQPPTKIGPTTPLKSKPPTGKTFVYLQCEQPQCQVVGIGVKAAVKALGWKLKTIPFVSTNPSTLIAGFNQALQEKPVGVGIIAEPFALWSSIIPKYKAAGVPIVSAFVGPAKTDDTLIANVADVDYSHLQGKLLADWFIGDSQAKGQALSVSIPDYPYLGEVSTGFDDATASQCSGCKVTKLKVGIPDLASGAINSKIVSALRQNPAIKYVVVSDVVFLQALPGALAAAGLKGKVKIAGCCGNKATEDGLRTGDFSAMSGVGAFIAGWQILDATLRHLQGLPVGPEVTNPSVGLLVSGTKVPAADTFDYPADYASQYQKLWKLN